MRVIPPQIGTSSAAASVQGEVASSPTAYVATAVGTLIQVQDGNDASVAQLNGGSPAAAASAPALPSAREVLAASLSTLVDALLEEPSSGGMYPEVPGVRESLERFARARAALGDGCQESLREILREQPDLNHELQLALNPRFRKRGNVDLAPLLSRLKAQDGTLRPFDPIREAFGAVNSRHRYGLGDRVAVRLDRGRVVEGLVVRNVDKAGLRIEYPASTGQRLTATLPWSEVLRENPIKIGDRLSNVPGLGTVVCEGVDGSGKLRGWVEGPRGGRRPLTVAGLQKAAERYGPLLAAQMDPRAPFPADLIQQAREASRSEVPVPNVPVGGSVHLAFVGGQETPGVVRLETEHLSIAFKVRKGLGYARPTEDAIVAGVFHVPDREAPGAPPREVAYLFVIDEAGGESHVEGRHAAATVEIAKVLESELALIREQGKSPKEAMRDFNVRADVAVRELNERSEAAGTLRGEATSIVSVRGARAAFIGAIVEKGRDVVLGWEGDPQAMLMAEGRLEQVTPRDNMGDHMAWQERDVNAGVGASHILRRALGTRSEQDAPHVSNYTLESGDALALYSDGVGDANDRAQLAAARAREALPESLHWNEETGNRHTVLQIEALHAEPLRPAAAVEAMAAHVLRGVGETGRAQDDDVAVGELVRK